MVRFGVYDLIVAAQKNDQYWKTVKLGIFTQDYTYSAPTQLAITRRDARMQKFLRTGGEELFQVHYYQRACGTNIEILDLVWQHRSTAPVRMPENKMIACLLRAISTGDEALLLHVIQHVSSIKPAVLPCIAASPLEQAMMRGHTHLLPPLLEITRLDKKRAVRVIAEAVRSREHSALAMLLASGPIAHFLSTEDRNTRSIMGFPNLIASLNLAIERHCPEMVDTLLSSSNVRLRDERGRTPLFVAALFSHISSLANIILYLPPNFFSFATRIGPEVGVALHLLIHNAGKHPSAPLFLLETFIELGARIKAKDFGFTALHAAAGVDRADIMQLLLVSMDQAEVESEMDEQVSALHREEWEGKTTLGIAARRGNVEIVRLFVGSDADIGVKDEIGKPAITLAMEGGYGDVVEVLRAVMWKDVSIRKRSASI
jgi:ankyrin repeat protein